MGFRPYVYRLAGELGLAGFVFNDARGVVTEVEGPSAAVEAFLARLAPEAPPLAMVEDVAAEERAVCGADAFVILESPRGEAPDAPVTPDTAVCAECLHELGDPGDRRFRYPFINCTNCGPRFTIVRGVPYDRPLTTMAAFAMCATCRAEYEDPADRRFHAQPNACPACGPSVTLLSGTGEPVDGSGRDPVAAAADALGDGAIVAVKGIGGYHLACRADDEDAVATLRARKHREDKPFALMAGDVTAAERLVVLGDAERALLQAPERPIVLAPRRPGAAVGAAVAPGSPELGVMLPYSPLHHLLLADAGVPLVMTSGNVSDEPIAYRDDDARARLSGIADLFLVHDRPIETRTDDSVVRVTRVSERPRPAVLRRSRGYVPASLGLPGAGTPRPLLACGAELKSTFCVARAGRAWVSHHIGDLQNYETLRSFTDGIDHFQRLFAVAPEVVAHDLHPEYLSTQYALEREGVELVGVQHHHAHLAACLAEHAELRPAVGAIFDGTGYGTDGTVWGGEFLFGDVRSCARVGTLVAVPLPGGAAAIRQPWRMACAWLQTRAGRVALAASLARGNGRCARLGPGGSAGRDADGLAADHEHGPAVRRRRRAERDPRRGHVRGPGGDRARGGVRRVGDRRLPDAGLRHRRDGRHRSAADHRGGGGRCGCRRARGRHLRALPRCGGAGHRGGVLPSGRRPRHRPRGPVGRRVPEPPAARIGLGRPGAGGPARARPRAPAGQRRRDRLRPGGGGRGGAGGAMTAPISDILEQRVFIGGAQRSFGSLSAADARAHADELRAAVGWGPTARVAPVAQAWRELSLAMDRAGAGVASDLEPEVLVELAPRLWVTLPG